MTNNLKATQAEVKAMKAAFNALTEGFTDLRSVIMSFSVFSGICQQSLNVTRRGTS